MKKVYYTCNVKNSKSKIVFFDSKKEADEYCELMNLANRNVDYRVAAINITSIKEIKSNNYESYKKMLENAIKNLKKELETITDKRHLFDVKFDDGFETYLTLDYMQKLLTDDYAYADEEVFSNPEAPTESVRMMEVKDLLVVDKVYNDAKKQIKKLKSDLTKYTKELFETVNGNAMEVSK